MKYRIVHKTEYRYLSSVLRCHNEARLQPRSTVDQVCQCAELSVNPRPADRRQRTDFFGNHTTYFEIHQPHDILTITATSECQVFARERTTHLAQSLPWDRLREQLRQDGSPEGLEARQFVLDSPLVGACAELLAYAQPSFALGRPLLEAVHDLMERIFKDFAYDPEFTTLATPLSEVLQHRRGVCQDFAHLAIGCLRAQRLPARYVSGYLETLPPPGKEKLIGADASHAWFAVYHPGYGWIDFDPTNNQMPMERHITTAWGRDYGDVTPLKGVIFGGGGRHQLVVSVDVQNITEAKTSDHPSAISPPAGNHHE